MRTGVMYNVVAVNLQYLSWILNRNTVAFNKCCEATTVWLHSQSVVQLTDRGTIFIHETVMHHAKTSTIQLHI